MFAIEFLISSISSLCCWLSRREVESYCIVAAASSCSKITCSYCSNRSLFKWWFRRSSCWMSSSSSFYLSRQN